jgi:hypothetical protein
MAVTHASDCAVHNEPALPRGPCDCGAETAALRAALEPIARHYTVNDCHEWDQGDNLEIPLRELRRAVDALKS